MLKRFITLAVLCLAGLPWTVPSASAAALTELVSERIEALLTTGEETPRLVLGEETVRMHRTLPRFYRARHFRCAWVQERGISDQAADLLEILRGAALDGLNPEDYHLTYIEALLELERDAQRYELLLNPEWMTDLELLLTDGFLLYASHLIQGRVDPRSLHEAWRVRLRKVDLARLLAYALDEHRLEAVLADLAPPHEGYRRLRRALADYRRISALGGWPQIGDGPLLRPGRRDLRVPALRRRLKLSGDLVELPEPAGDYFDAELAAALKRFQRRHGLAPDAVLGPRSRAALNVAVEERIRQIELNMERWRWLPKSLGERHLMVNIADFSLELVEDGRTVLTMPVVVGTDYRKTPVFSSWISYLVFSPYWNVPPTILREDKLPRIKADPTWLVAHRYEIVTRRGKELVPLNPLAIDWERVEAESFPGILRQRPGPWNPLGRVKFMLPNPFSVYLHDTNQRSLFDRRQRSFSSGCIRLERPLDLALFLLAEDGWNCEDLVEAMEGDAPLTVPLEQPLSAHIQYWTARVDEEGTVQFRPDLYWRDLDLDLALIEPGGEGDL